MESPETAGIARLPKSLMKKLRRFLQDFVEYNELIDAQESEDEFLMEMLVDAAIEFNTVEPVTTAATIDLSKMYQLTHRIRKYLIDLAAARVLKSVSIRMKRNFIQVSGGNIQENLNDKFQYYASTIDQLNADNTKITGFKAQLNAEGAWGTVLTPLYSPYFMNMGFVEYNT